MSTKLTPEEQMNGFIRPVRTRVKHSCGNVSIVRTVEALDMARDPTSWSSCFCASCEKRLPASQFAWFPDGEAVGS